jgi:hypothetical protein
MKLKLGVTENNEVLQQSLLLKRNNLFLFCTRPEEEERKNANFITKGEESSQCVFIYLCV